MSSPFDPHRGSWRVHELSEGQTLAGTVARLPEAGAFNGSRLFLRTSEGEVLAVRATAKSGHTMLENQLSRLSVTVGDEIAVTFAGWGTTEAGYNIRNYQVRT